MNKIEQSEHSEDDIEKQSTARDAKQASENSPRVEDMEAAAKLVVQADKLLANSRVHNDPTRNEGSPSRNSIHDKEEKRRSERRKSHGQHHHSRKTNDVEGLEDKDSKLPGKGAIPMNSPEYDSSRSRRPKPDHSAGDKKPMEKLYTGVSVEDSGNDLLARLYTLDVIDSDPILEAFSIKTLPSKSMKAEGDTGSQEGGDYIAAFHVQAPSKIKSIAAYLDRCISYVPPNAKGASPLRCLIISKVEYQVSTVGLEETIKESDGVLVLNGSLGNGTPQKQYISGFGQYPELSLMSASKAMDLAQLDASEAAMLMDSLQSEQEMGWNTLMADDEGTMNAQQSHGSSGQYRTAPQPTRPGAVAVDGPDSDRPAPIRAIRSQASVVRADAVDDAEVVIYASSVSPDERVKMRRRMVIMGIVAILVIIGVAFGVLATSKSGQGVGEPPSSSFICGEDIFECCKYYNSTGNIFTSTEESYYNDLQSLLFNEGTISEMYGVDSCEPQNQCMVWLANYEQRGITGEEAQMALSDRPKLLVQDYILCMMYLTLGGEEWDRNYEWLRDTDACNWYGLSCSLLSRIAIIDLASNGLNGSLPLELGLMPFLEEVNLSHNPGVIGTIPSELTQASGLRALDLSNTRMNGTIPAEIERLEILDNLNLGNSSFSGTVPASLSRLERIRILYLDQNQFSGTLHRDFGNLTNIERLNINGNNFGGSIPEEFSSWQFLQHIDLSRNDFTGTFPLFLGDLRYLVTIGLYDTQIGGSIPESFCGSTSSRSQVIILNCSQAIIPSCSCCDDLVFCVEDDLPEDFT